MKTKPVVGQTYQLNDTVEPRLRGRFGVARTVQQRGAGFQVLLDLGGGESVPVLSKELVEPITVGALAGSSAPPPGVAPVTSPGHACVTVPAGRDRWGEDTADLSEAAEGRRFVAALVDLADEYPEIGLAEPLAGRPAGWRVRHNANGGKRANSREGDDFRRQGVRPGVPDYTLDIARYDPYQRKIYFGWHGELKRATGGDIAEHQRVWLADLRARGYWARTHSGHEEMRLDLRMYLSLIALPPNLGQLFADLTTACDAAVREAAGKVGAP